MDHSKLEDITTVAQLAERYPHHLSSPRLRWWIYRSIPRRGVHGVLPANGFARAVRRVNGRVFLLESEVWAWINAGDDTQGGEHA